MAALKRRQQTNMLGNPDQDEPKTEHDIQEENAARSMIGFFERYERNDSQEALAFSSCHWSLSSDDFRLPVEPPVGLITSMLPVNTNNFVFLIPIEKPLEKPLCLREIHQIVRELMIGIFALNQIPTISLEANFDQSTSVQLPPAYVDTKVGQLLSNVDYMMKGLWHGVHFPRDKRTKFTERWRISFDVNNNGKPETKKNLVNEFYTAGMIDITDDPYYAHAYDTIPPADPDDICSINDHQFFMQTIQDISLQMYLYQTTVQQHKNMFVLDTAWDVGSVIRLTEERINQAAFEKLNERLLQHQLIIKENLELRPDIRKQLALLRVTSFLVPFLMAMRKKMKIPDVTRLLSPLGGDETRTEKEFPPLILKDEVKCPNFLPQETYFHLHGGIQIDHETRTPVAPSQALVDKYEELVQIVDESNEKYIQYDLPILESYAVPYTEIDGKTYAVFSIEFETFYPQTPQKPKWVHVICDEMAKLKLKRLPLTDINTHELFKKHFGYKRAIKYKTLQNGLRAAAIRGLVAMFITLMRKCPASRLQKLDERGLTLTHYAALNNRPHILGLLILQGVDINVRRHSLQSMGPTPLHLACRCGCLDAAACLLANGANSLLPDQVGWAPIHLAAFYDHAHIITFMIRKSDALLELNTRDELRSTPLLLAASSGAQNAVKCLISLGANIVRKDEAGNNMVHVAALRFHTSVLEYFILWNHPDVPVWKLLVGMLRDNEFVRQDSSVRCLEVLSVSDEHHWKCILDAEGVQALVDLCRSEDDRLIAVAASVLCNISEHEPIRKALTMANAGSILIEMLKSPVDDIQSRAAIVLADLACVDDNQSMIAQNSGVMPLIQLLDSDLEDVLVNTVNALRVLCDNNPTNQTEVARSGAIEPLVEFLEVDSFMLQAASSAALAALTRHHTENQDAVVSQGAVRPLVELILGKNVTVQVKAASALEALVENNPRNQQAFLQLDAEMALIKLTKIWSIQVKEQGTLALWALAGHTPGQRRFIAQQMGIPALIESIMFNSDTLQYVGCKAMIALAWENLENQSQIGAEGIQPLVRLIRSGKASLRVLRASIQTLGVLCVGVAMRNNKHTQKLIVEENALDTLIHLLLEPPSPIIQVVVAHTIACIALANQPNQELLKENHDFGFRILLDLLYSTDTEIVLKAGEALAIFAFNNTHQQYNIRHAGGMSFDVFAPFIDTGDDFQKCSAAFQIVVLARCIVDKDQVFLTALGVQTLVKVLHSRIENAVILAGSLISSLAHTRAGIPDAMVTSGAVETLVVRLSSDNERVRSACAVALGYLSFNRTAARLLLSACRNLPGLHKALMENIGPDAKISAEFLDNFRRAQVVGLPSQSLEKNGGPPVRKERPGTSQSQLARHTGLKNYSRNRSKRIQSAPPHVGHHPAYTKSLAIGSLSPSRLAAKIETKRTRHIVKTTRPMVKVQEIAVGSVFQDKLASWDD